MAEVSVEPVTRANWRGTMKLGVRPEQQRFVADHTPIAAVMLAKAYVRPGAADWRPYVVFAEGEPVGMFELVASEGGPPVVCWLYHFFIDARFQGRGFGTAALNAALALVRSLHAGASQVLLTVHPENVAAQALYKRAGFAPTGDLQDGEPVYSLALNW